MYAAEVAKQIETPHPPDPIMRRPRADRGEKRVTYGNGLRKEEQLDTNNPNQRGLLSRSDNVLTSTDKVLPAASLAIVFRHLLTSFFAAAWLLAQSQPSDLNRAGDVPRIDEVDGAALPALRL